MTAQEQPTNKLAPLQPNMEKIFAAQRDACQLLPYPSRADRADRLTRLKKLIIENKDTLAAAINKDFGNRSLDETLMFDVMLPVQYINYNLKNMKRWMKPQRRHLGLHMQPASAKVVYQPLGMVGIIGAWNYPLFLVAAPLAAVLAAGNRAMIKMSEHNPASGALFAELISQAFSPDEVCVFNGDVAIAKQLTSLDLDHIIFTGSTRIGREIMSAAADHLTPVTLELGGKSPAIISETADMANAALRICHGKTANGGQICVAPDYALIPKGRSDDFLKHIQRSYQQLYPYGPSSDDCTSIVNEAQFQRLQAWLEDAKLKGATITNMAPDYICKDRKMPLYVVSNLNSDMMLMQEEIFGPILPIIEYNQFDDAIYQIQTSARPLAAYYFGSNADEIQIVEKHTHSGGVTINDCLFHATVDDAPFGGVGPSGMGHYHGKEGFLQFSKAKTILTKGPINTSRLLYPPFGKFIHKLIYRYLIR